jgi:hypothetical protein
MLKADDFILPPLPNHLFQRDNSCWIYGGVTIKPMAKARQRESLHTKAIYRFHPLFADAEFLTYNGAEDKTYQPATIEGGDVHVIGHGAVLIGMGERTTPMAIESVAHALFDNGQATKIVAIELPHSHAFMHLDTVIAGLQRAGRDPRLVWLDAHGDFNTEASSPSGYLGGLPLALAVGGARLDNRGGVVPAHVRVVDLHPDHGRRDRGFRACLGVFWGCVPYHCARLCGAEHNRQGVLSRAFHRVHHRHSGADYGQP